MTPTVKRPHSLRAKIAIASAVSLAAVASGGTAFANSIGDSTCPHGNNYTSSACFYGTTQLADSAVWNNQQMYIDPAYAAAKDHINETLWAYSGNPCRDWMELGLTDGYDGHDVYGLYWAADDPTTGYTEDFYAYEQANNSDNTYEVAYDGNRNYSAYYNGGLVVRSTAGQFGAGTCMAQAGLEESANVAPNANYWTDAFEVSPLRWESLSGTWNTGWAANEYWVDYPCNGHPYSAPDCLNGSQYSTSHWGDDHPQAPSGQPAHRAAVRPSAALYAASASAATADLKADPQLGDVRMVSAKEMRLSALLAATRNFGMDFAGPLGKTAGNQLVWVAAASGRYTPEAPGLPGGQDIPRYNWVIEVTAATPATRGEPPIGILHAASDAAAWPAFFNTLPNVAGQ